VPCRARPAVAKSGGQPLAATRAAGRQDLAAAGFGHAGAETVAALAHELARLVGPLHSADYSRAAPPPSRRGLYGAGEIKSTRGIPVERSFSRWRISFAPTSA